MWGFILKKDKNINFCFDWTRPSYYDQLFNFEFLFFVILSMLFTIRYLKWFRISPRTLLFTLFIYFIMIFLFYCIFLSYHCQFWRGRSRRKIVLRNIKFIALMKHVISLYSLVKYFVKWIQGANILCMLFQSIFLGISHYLPMQPVSGHYRSYSAKSRAFLHQNW